MIPRDPKRIDRIIELLREAWYLFPDERLTQLGINISDTHHDCGPVFYLEDDKMEQMLRKMIDGRCNFLPTTNKFGLKAPNMIAQGNALGSEPHKL